jgi:hypothetical protein
MTRKPPSKAGIIVVPPTELALALKELRVQGGHNMRSWSEKVFASIAAISLVESGKRSPSKALVKRWLTAAGCQEGDNISENILEKLTASAAGQTPQSRAAKVQEAVDDIVAAVNADLASYTHARVGSAIRSKLLAILTSLLEKSSVGN